MALSGPTLAGITAGIAGAMYYFGKRTNSSTVQSKPLPPYDYETPYDDRTVFPHWLGARFSTNPNEQSQHQSITSRQSVDPPSSIHQGNDLPLHSSWWKEPAPTRSNERYAAELTGGGLLDYGNTTTTNHNPVNDNWSPSDTTIGLPTDTNAVPYRIPPSILSPPSMVDEE